MVYVMFTCINGPKKRLLHTIVSKSIYKTMAHGFPSDYLIY